MSAVSNRIYYSAIKKVEADPNSLMILPVNQTIQKQKDFNESRTEDEVNKKKSGFFHRFEAFDSDVGNSTTSDFNKKVANFLYQYAETFAQSDI